MERLYDPTKPIGVAYDGSQFTGADELGAVQIFQAAGSGFVTGNFDPLCMHAGTRVDALFTPCERIIILPSAQRHWQNMRDDPRTTFLHATRMIPGNDTLIGMAKVIAQGDLFTSEEYQRAAAYYSSHYIDARFKAKIAAADLPSICASFADRYSRTGTPRYDMMAHNFVLAYEGSHPQYKNIAMYTYGDIHAGVHRSIVDYHFYYHDNNIDNCGNSNVVVIFYRPSSGNVDLYVRSESSAQRIYASLEEAYNLGMDPVIGDLYLLFIEPRSKKGSIDGKDIETRIASALV